MKMFKSSRNKRRHECEAKEIVLVNTRLRFCSDQLVNLNYLFTKLIEADSKYENVVIGATVPDSSITLAKSVTERLIQRLLCGVGQLDARFSSKYLIALHETNAKSNLEVEYLVRLDALSFPRLYKDDETPMCSIYEGDAESYPPGYAKFILYGETAQAWGDLTNQGGYLRRDKVQARFVELLATAAGGDSPVSPLYVDESTLCASPGKVLDAADLHKILHISSEKHVYHGPAGNCPRFPDPRDFRLAIVDEPAGVKLRVGFLSPVLSNITVEVRLLVAIGLDGWPSCSTFPNRVPLGHVDCLLYNRAALSGMYLVGYGVQSSSWQVRLPAAESILMKNYNNASTVIHIHNVLLAILDDIHSNPNRNQQMSYKILNKYVLKTILLYELEKDFSNPITVMYNWAQINFSRHVLRILDRTIGSLRRRHQPSYFFPNANLLPNPGHLLEEDYEHEASRIQTYLLKLFDESLTPLQTAATDCKQLRICAEMENALMNKWMYLVAGLVPPPTTRSRRFCFAASRSRKEIAYTQYTQRQLEYIGLLVKSVLLVKQKVAQAVDGQNPPWFETGSGGCGRADVYRQEVGDGDAHSSNECPTEDVVYLLVMMMEQARDYVLGKDTRIFGRKADSLKNKAKLRTNFDAAMRKLVELVRKDSSIRTYDISDDLVMVKTILKWLYKGLDQNKRYLAPILRPFLNVLFATSHEISWHLEDIKNRNAQDELNALGTFCSLVNKRTLTPAEGLIDSVNKGWTWAKQMLALVEKTSVRVVFTPGRNKVYRHVLSLPSYEKSDQKQEAMTSRSASSSMKKGYSGLNTSLGVSTLPNKEYFSTVFRTKTEQTPKRKSNIQNDILRDSSPMTSILDMSYRKGNHRCCGDLIHSLMTMQKLNVLQEVSNYLPQTEKQEFLDALHKASKESKKQSFVRRRNSVANGVCYGTTSSATATPTPYPKYTPKEESAGIRLTPRPSLRSRRQSNAAAVATTVNPFTVTGEKISVGGHREKMELAETLRDSCAAARMREDNGVNILRDNAKVRSLLMNIN